MNWTSPADVGKQLRRAWDRGDLLRPLVTGGDGFPLRLTLKGPSSPEMTDHFEAVRDWVADLLQMDRIRIEWREFRHRVHGLQRLPAEIWLDTLEDALLLIGRSAEAERFDEVLARTRIAVPGLLPWLSRAPLRALDHAAQWPSLLAIVQWLQAHPRPAIYLRQVDIPGIDSKFIEGHRAILTELLDHAMPPGAFDASQAGTGRFAARYGFREKPVRIRFRVLDPRLDPLARSETPDITLDADNFAALDLPAQQIFVTENEINFLAFPKLEGGIVVFGAGYGWDALAKAGWLNRCAIRYWGDIDTHGFAILDELRDHFDHVSSFLMDRDTLHMHEPHWGTEPMQVSRDLHHLTAQEQALFDDLRYNRIRTQLRLEQERVGFHWVAKALAK